MTSPARTIITHTNYRDYLRELYAMKKTARAGYSWRRFAEDLGLNPSNFLHLVATGKRNLSQEALETIKAHLELSAQQKKFFHYLVLWNQETVADLADKWRGELDKILGKKRKLIPPDQFAYFSTWYIPVIREILVLKDFASSLGWIARKLKPAISPIAVREAILLR